MKNRPLLLVSLFCFGASLPLLQAQTLPIVYVTQVPPSGTTNTVTSIGNNHLPSAKAAPRGGDLMIRYVDGTLRFLTKEAGFGVSTQAQGFGAIAVRDPHIHWTGQRILFSMVVNTANPAANRWQIYEATGFEQGRTVHITRVDHQPAEFNNVQPCYAPDERIIYVSDRTRDGSLATYPAIDEKGQGQINTGLWSLSRATGDIFHLEHSPSGSFDPFVDSFGRVLFTRWDHLQRDEKATAATAFDYSSEAKTATYQPGVFSESFPEALTNNGSEFGLQFDLFMPWTVNPDGTELVTLNHVGRHEFSPAALRSRPDSNLSDLLPNVSAPFATTPIRAASLMQLTEHPVTKGRYFGTDAIITGLSAGRIVSIMSGGPTVNPASMQLRLTAGQGIMRDPAVLTDGRLIASVVGGTTVGGPNLGGQSYGGGGPAVPAPPPVVNPNLQLAPSTPFLLTVSTTNASAIIPNFGFTTQIASQSPVTVSNEDNGQSQSFTGVLWQLQPAEVRATTRPAAAVSKMEAPEREMFYSAGVSPLALKAWLRQNDMAMMTVRNVTQRDSADHQQPTNLAVAVPGGVSSVKDDGGPTYQIKALQVLQGEYLRGYTDGNGNVTARRIKAVTTRPVPGITQTPAGLPEGSNAISADGSVAVLVPAKRATSWQLIEHNGSPVVRERYWLSFQSGEIRSCTSCHGVNRTDQLGQSTAPNPPAALGSLLQSVKQAVPEVAATSTFSIWSEATLGLPLDADEDDDADGTSNMIEWGMGSSPVLASDKPATPLAVSLQQNTNGKFARVAFSRNIAETHARVVVEGSADLQTWRTVGAFDSNPPIVSGEYSLARTPLVAGKTENVLLTSTVPATESQDKFFRMRVIAQ